MMRPTRNWFVFLIAFVASRPASGQAVPATGADWSAVEQALGRKGTVQPGGVIRFGFPRSDLQVTVAGILLRPTFALGSWVAFKRTGKETIAMGDLVLTETEVDPVMRALQEGRVEQTALHNHVFGNSPA